MSKVSKLAGEFFDLKIKEMTKPVIQSSGEKLFNCIKSIEYGSNKISTWALTSLGGTVLAILSGEYSHPNKFELRIIYLLFVFGWACIGVSLYYGKEIVGRTIASELYKDDVSQLTIIFTESNKCYSRQLRFFNIAMLIFGVWLVLFLLMWVFVEGVASPPKS